MRILVNILLWLLSCQYVLAQAVSSIPLSSQEKNRLYNSQWNGRKVAFLGDSITDKKRIGTNYLYWEYLVDWLSIAPYVYGKSGHTWKDLLQQSEALVADGIDSLSTIVLFAGTNDFNSSVPLGTLFKEDYVFVNHNGNRVERKRRTFTLNHESYYGRINTVFHYLKSKFPEQQIIVLTPMHRGFAQFSLYNVQPDERHANAEGLFIDDYVHALKSAAMQWSIPVVDLFGAVNLQPLMESNAIFFADKDNDLLHPNTLGHERMARFIAYQMLVLP